MFSDARGKKVLFVSHCILNQNAKMDRCAYYSGPIYEIVRVLLEAGIGIIQMPCPELHFLGLDRETEQTLEPSIGEEDTRIALRMKEPRCRAMLQEIAWDVTRQISEYKKNGFEVLGILGCNGSPTCGVEVTWYEGQEHPQPGILFQTLIQTLKDKGLSLPLAGVRASQAEEAESVVRKMCAC